MEEFINRMSGSFQSELGKIAQARVKTGGAGSVGSLLTNKYLLGAGAGVLGWEQLKKLDKDRKLGRAIRQQQRGGY